MPAPQQVADHPVRRAPSARSALVLVAVSSAALTVLLARRGWFYYDDFWNLTIAHDLGWGWDLLGRPVFGHVTPGANAFIGFVAGRGPSGYVWAVAIAGVFARRLKIGMRLQTDPTVIYGMGAAYAGNIRRSDLATDTPYNTYTRAGLPPTPIAMPGMASLRAAVRPEPTKALYFVARGDGSSAFSETLAEHNRAVNQFQRGK